MNEIPWVTVWGFGADIKTTRDSLLISKKGKTKRYALNEINHLLICGSHNLRTSAIETLSKNNISISFFDAHANPTGVIRAKNTAMLFERQKNIPVQKYALVSIKASLEARMRYLHELSEMLGGELYYKGEFEIMSGARNELDYLITLPEFARVFNLTKNMYYEILSRAVPAELGFKRRTSPPHADSFNALLSFGYSVLYSNIAAACIGAGLDLSIGALYGRVDRCPGGKMPCVMDIFEPASVYAVDKPAVEFARAGKLLDGYEHCDADASCSLRRCILSEDIISEFGKILVKSISDSQIDANVKHYADAVCEKCEPALHF